jgi:ribonucleoside-diphosphate reductase alpha chain
MPAAMKKIDQQIVSWSVVTDDEPTAPPIVTYDRPAEMDGTTYKIKPVGIDCAMYITINNCLMPDGSLRPLEMFINSKHTAHHQWITAMTRMVSAVFRKPGAIDFAIEELEEVFDPAGGYWVDGKMVPSLVAHVGMVLRKHCEKIGIIAVKELTSDQRVVIEEKIEVAQKAGVEMQLCEKCREKGLLFLDNCWTCVLCGDSKCS